MPKHETHLERPLSALDVIFTRRSVRAYTGQKIDQETIRALLDAAVRAPTAMHAEPWLFLVIQDERTLNKYSDLTKTTALAALEHHAALDMAPNADRDRFLAQLRDPGFSPFYGAGTLIVIYGRTKGSLVTADCWLAAENLMLAACALGLGTCIIGAAVDAFNLADANEEFRLPADALAVAPIVVGVPAGPGADAPGRRDPEIIWS